MEKKYYSFCSLQKENGKVFATVNGTLFGLEAKDVGEKKLVAGRLALNNVSRRVASALEIELPDEEALFIDVNFWDDRAERIAKFFGEREKARVCLTGRLRANKFTRADGTEGVAVALDVQDWFGLGAPAPADGE